MRSIEGDIFNDIDRPQPPSWASPLDPTSLYGLPSSDPSFVESKKSLNHTMTH